MARTALRSTQISDGGIKRQDLNVVDTGEAVITKVIAGFGMGIDSTGVDSGTGDVTVRSTKDIVVATNGELDVLVIGTPVYISAANTVKKGKADASGTVSIVGLVQDVSVGMGVSGKIQVGDVLLATTGQWDVVTGQVGGLTPGACYYLDPVNAGKITTNAPATQGQYVVVIGMALSSTQLLVAIKQPVLLGPLTLSSVLYI